MLNSVNKNFQYNKKKCTKISTYVFTTPQKTFRLMNNNSDSADIVTNKTVSEWTDRTTNQR